VLNFVHLLSFISELMKKTLKLSFSTPNMLSVAMYGLDDRIDSVKSREC